MEKRYSYNKALGLTIIKYLFSLILTIIAVNGITDKKYFLVGVIELLIIATLSEIIVCRKRTIGVVCNNIFMLLYNVQMMVLFFGNSYVTLVMLTNINSISGLSGKAIPYVAGAIFVFIFSFIPIRSITTKKKIGVILLCELVVEVCFVLFMGSMFSPMLSLGNLLYDAIHEMQIRGNISSETNLTGYFYKDTIEGFRHKDNNLVEEPNVIVIFTEGLSEHIINDERNIMPNVAKLQDESLSFSNYYNHTFATYRGLIGQLYSGYQLDHLDTNTLVSMQEILKENNYSTTFINVEPKNADFTNYLNTFGFDELISSTEWDHNGASNTISDKDAFSHLFDTMLQREQENEPFFVSIYTFGTHVTFDSPNEVFGDGKDPVLNRFYNLDVWFGKFMDEFNKSNLSENTIIIFTTDHATYMDNDYTKAFPNTTRTILDLDTIPLLIYYKGITPEVIDASGRNSLCMAPTILDYLDISAPNYFLGDSLFGEKDANNIFDTTFIKGATIRHEWGNGETMSLDESNFIEKQIQNYFIAKTQEQSRIARDIDASEVYSGDEHSAFNIDISPDNTEIKLTFETTKIYDRVLFPVRNWDDGENDYQWYEGVHNGDGIWTSTVTLSDDNSTGEYTVEVYAYEGEVINKITTGTITVD